MKRLLFIIGFVFVMGLLTRAQTNYTKTPSGIKAETEGTLEIELQVYSPSIIRVFKTQKGNQVEKESLSVVKTPEKDIFTVQEKNNEVIVKTEFLEASLNLITGKVVFKNNQGILLQEKNYGAQFTPFNDAGNSTFLARQAFRLDEDEAIYGLGQYQNGKMIQRNQRVVLKNSNHDITIPYFYSVSKGYSVFWDNYAPTTFTDNLQETSFEALGECVDYYFLYGEDGDGTVAQMRDLTGKAPMFPLWTFGYWQCKEHYKTQFELVDVFKKYRDLNVPIDGIIQDWRYWGEDSLWNAMDWDPERYPNPAKMAEEVHDMNGHLMVVAWPGFSPLTEQYKIFEEKNMLIDFETWPPTCDTRPYDVYNPEARKIYWDFLKKGVFSIGTDAWWLDSTEPDHIDVKERDFDQPTHLGTYRSVSNAYSLAHTTGIYNHQRQTTEDKRVFILTRSSFAGQQRNASVSWSGDVIADWDVLHQQIPAALNFSVCGVPYWNSDIGGFFVWHYPGGKDNVAYREIYVRWLQFGTFSPMMRSHGTDTPREIWQFGEKGDWEYDAIEKFIKLRYRLLPYLYSTGWQVTNNDATIMKPLAFDFAEDKAVYDIDNQYMFGESFMVRPVTEPMYTKFDKDGNRYVNSEEDFSTVKNTRVYLPEGTTWYDFWTSEAISGGRYVEKETPVDIMPLYVKAGSIIPWGPDVQYAEEEKWDNLEIRIYPGADGTFTLYEDENDNYNYEDGAYSTIEFAWDDAKKELKIGNREGQFKKMLKKRQFNLVLVEEGIGNGIPETEKDKKTITYNGKAKSVDF